MDDFVYPSITPTNIESVVWSDSIYNQLLDKIRQWEDQWTEAQFRKLPEFNRGVDCIYKYRAINPEHPEWTEELFADQKLWSPSISNLNDPLEAAFLYGKAIADPTIADAVKMMMKSNWFGCICFTRDPICVQMWAHYAADHSGYCIEYYRPSSFLLSAYCKPVLYRRQMPEIENIKRIDKLFWTKSEAWEYEAEWRLQYIRADAHTDPGLLKPNGVIFGLRTPDSTKQLIRSGAGNIRFGQIERSREPYRIKVKWE